MNRLIALTVFILMIFPVFSGCIFSSDDDSNGDGPATGFEKKDLVAPDHQIAQKYKNVYTKPDPENTSHKTAFKYETTWAFQYNTVFAKEGGVVQMWLTNSGDSEMFIYEFGIAPDWLAESAMTETGSHVLPRENIELGYTSFPGPSEPGTYNYQLKFGILARADDNSSWTDWGTIGNKSYEVDVKPLTDSNSISEYKIGENIRSLYEKINELVDTSDPDVRAKAVLLAKKYEGAYNVFQLCEIFEYIKNNVSYVNDPRGDDNYWSSPAETLLLCAGDCEDQAILFSALAGAISGTTRLYLTDTHAFAAVYIGDNEAARDGVFSAIDTYYGTELRYAYFTDEHGYWLVIDPIGALHPGGLPLGGEPVSDGGSGGLLISGINTGRVWWDITDTENLYVIDVI